MPLNGIDISSNNKGIDLAKISCDFVIVKATQGKTYTNPYFKTWCKQARNRGMLLGVYHYISGIGAKAEAEHFWSVIDEFAEDAMICVDWEQIQNGAWEHTEYLDEFLMELEKLSGGRKVMLYASLAHFPSVVAKKHGCGRWVAQYANYEHLQGFQSKPWNEGAYQCDIRQYSEYGYLPGWSGRLDFNKAYMTRDGWLAWCGKNATPVKPTPPKKDSYPQSFKGRWKVITPSGVNVRRKASTKGNTPVGRLDKGVTVFLDKTRIKADGYWWGTYIGNSGKRCYVAVGKVDGTRYMEVVK